MSQTRNTAQTAGRHGRARMCGDPRREPDPFSVANPLPKEHGVTIKAEYIWIDGTEPTPLLRSKTKVIPKGGSVGDLPIWGFDGSSTNQAPGKASDCVLKPVCSGPDPIRGGDSVLVLCEVLLTDMTPHPTNTRTLLQAVADKYADQ